VATRQTSNRSARPGAKKLDNLLLAALPLADRERILPTLTIIPLPLRQVLHAPGRPIDQVYFPGAGFCSVVTVLANGMMVEVATVGREGMVGLPALSGYSMPTSATMVQGAGETCYRMPASVFRREMTTPGPFRTLLTRYADAHLSVVMQSTACNAVHSLEQRLARWLLMAHDRMQANEFALTQEFAAMMLGAARPTVSLIAGALQRDGLIAYRRGRVLVADRAGLEKASCECYQTVAALLRKVSAPS
jgi:CRP-like cAMP-binding protein